VTRLGVWSPPLGVGKVYVHQQQRKLKDLLEDAQEWAAARDVAARERESDWDTLCRAADQVCPHGASCSYAAAAAVAFERNRGVLSQESLASALRAVIVKGPSKTTRVPL
jgi:hypothetical protein